MGVVLTLRARNRLRVVAKWWRRHRPKAPHLFDEEIEEAFDKLRDGPTFGLVYQTVRGHVIRRMLLPGSDQHLYYSANHASETVIVHTIWGARRGRGPKL